MDNFTIVILDTDADTSLDNFIILLLTETVMDNFIILTQALLGIISPN